LSQVLEDSGSVAWARKGAAEAVVTAACQTDDSATFILAVSWLQSALFVSLGGTPLLSAQETTALLDKVATLLDVKGLDTALLLSTMAVALQACKGAPVQQAWVDAVVAAADRAVAARRRDVTMQALHLLRLLAERDLREVPMTLGNFLPVLCHYFDTVAVPLLLQSNRCSCPDCALGSRVVQIVEASPTLAMLAQAGAFDFFLAVMHWAPYGSLPTKDLMPVLCCLLLHVRLTDRMDFRRTDNAALLALLQKVALTRESSVALDGILSLPNIASNHNEVLEALRPELSRLLNAVEALGVEQLSTKERSEPEDQVDPEIQWSSHNPQEDEDVPAKPRPLIVETAPKPLRADEVVILHSRVLQVCFQAEQTLPGVDERAAREMLTRTIGALRRAGVPPSAVKSDELAFHSLRTWLVLSRAAYHRREYARLNRKTIEREKTCVAWLLCIHRGRPGGTCELIEGMANDVLSWLYWQNPAASTSGALSSGRGEGSQAPSSGRGEGSQAPSSGRGAQGSRAPSSTRGSSRGALSAKGKHPRTIQEEPEGAFDDTIDPADLNLDAADTPDLPPDLVYQSSVTRWTEQLDDMVFEAAIAAQNGLRRSVALALTPQGAAYVALFACAVVFLNQLARALGFL
jgi:hypothetical protein